MQQAIETIINPRAVVLSDKSALIADELAREMTEELAAQIHMSVEKFAGHVFSSKRNIFDIVNILVEKFVYRIRIGKIGFTGPKLTYSYDYLKLDNGVVAAVTESYCKSTPPPCIPDIKEIVRRIIATYEANGYEIG